MSDRITRWLDESQQLADKATEGPWAWSAAAHGLPTDGPTHHAVRARGGVVAETDYDIHGALDAEFIAESRTRLPQAVAALRAVLDVLDRWAPPDPHESDEGCPDCELLHHAQQAIADALGLEGDGDEQ